jgi:hypothetical protein
MRPRLIADEMPNRTFGPNKKGNGGGKPLKSENFFAARRKYKCQDRASTSYHLPLVKNVF